jgi:hypothetical protein
MDRLSAMLCNGTYYEHFPQGDSHTRGSSCPLVVTVFHFAAMVRFYNRLRRPSFPFLETGEVVSSPRSEVVKV